MLTAIVDKTDRIVGYRQRGQVAPGEIYRVTGLWLLNSKGETLLAQRALSKANDPGCWGPAVSGTVEKGETYRSNILKEAEEELGITGMPFAECGKLYVSDNGYGRGYFCQLYAGRTDLPAQSFRLQASEVASVRWWPMAELKSTLQARPQQFTIQFAEALHYLEAKAPGLPVIATDEGSN